LGGRVRMRKRRGGKGKEVKGEEGWKGKGK
jgi:hypothetical protein